MTLASLFRSAWGPDAHDRDEATAEAGGPYGEAPSADAPDAAGADADGDLLDALGFDYEDV